MAELREEHLDIPAGSDGPSVRETLQAAYEAKVADRSKTRRSIDF